jgi:hypothetical protein
MKISLGPRYDGESGGCFGGGAFNNSTSQKKNEQHQSSRNIRGINPRKVGVIINRQTWHTSQANKETLFGPKARSVPGGLVARSLLGGPAHDIQCSTAMVFVATW